jgi:hypothetical protein
MMPPYQSSLFLVCFVDLRTDLFFALINNRKLGGEWKLGSIGNTQVI